MGMKKIVLFIIIILVVFAFSACKTSKKEMSTASTNISMEIPETGNIIDLTEKNNQIAYASAGDILLIAFKDSAKSQNQWSFRGPIEQKIVTLKEHNIITENDSRIKDTEILNEWRLKVLNDTDFEIVFLYENSLKPSNPTRYFRVFVINYSKRNKAPDLILSSPKNNDALSQKFILQGYSKSKNKIIHYAIENEEMTLLSQGIITLPDNTSYFEKIITLKNINNENGFLTIYQKNDTDNSQYNVTKIPINFDK